MECVGLHVVAFPTVRALDEHRCIVSVDNFQDTGVVITEHVLRTATGVSLLESARTMRPAARRVLLTTYHDLASIVAGLHSGAIDRLVSKPFTVAELLHAILPEGEQEPASQRASA